MVLLSLMALVFASEPPLAIPAQPRPDVTVRLPHAPAPRDGRGSCLSGAEHAGPAHHGGVLLVASSLGRGARGRCAPGRESGSMRPPPSSDWGDPAASRVLMRRIRSTERTASLLQGVGVVGVGALVTGLVASDRATSLDSLRRWERVAGVGGGLMLFSVVTAPVPARRAVVLHHDVTATLDPAELEARVHAYNTRLAEELGVSPER